MNVLWPKTKEQDLDAEVQVSASEKGAASLDHVPVQEALKPCVSREDEQTLQLLQANRKLEAQLQVWHDRCAFCLIRCNHGITF
jgi:hypothetical protein